MPDYHKQFIGELSQVSYHIIGYGSHYEEALIRYLGESIERYAVSFRETCYLTELFMLLIRN